MMFVDGIDMIDIQITSNVCHSVITLVYTKNEYITPIMDAETPQIYNGRVNYFNYSFIF